MHLVIKTSHISSGPPAIPESRISRFRFWPWHFPRDLSETGDAQALVRIRPNPFRFTSRLVLKLWLLRLTSLTILGPPSAQSSFACHQRYSWQGGVQHHLEGHCPFFIAPTSSCAKPAPSSGFVYPHLFPAVLAGRCEPLLGTGSSRRYLRNSFLRCLVLNPDGPTECICLFLPRRHRPSLDPSQVGFPLLPRTRFSAVRFRGCRRTFLAFKPPSLLVSQIAPTAANFAGRPRLVLPGRTCFVASARTGYAIRLIQAIDGERTFTFPDLRPCRLLQGPSLISRIVTQNRATSCDAPSCS